VRVRARSSARTATAEMTDTPSPAATSRLVASTLPSSMATRGRTPPRWNHVSITRRMVPPRSYRISGDSARSAGRSAPRRGQRWCADVAAHRGLAQVQPLGRARERRLAHDLREGPHVDGGKLHARKYLESFAFGQFISFMAGRRLPWAHGEASVTIREAAPAD